MLVSPKRWQHFAAMVLIGDGVMALVHPREDAEAWAVGPACWRQFMRKFEECPTMARAVGAAQIVGGVCWALWQERE